MNTMNVEYLQGSVTVNRMMNQYELAALLLDDEVLLLSVNAEKPARRRKKKVKAVNSTHK